MEDDEELCTELRDILEDEGYEVSSAHDGNEGLRLADAGGHDLILLDLKLPGLSGLGILKALRDKGDSTLILVMTGHPFGTTLPDQNGLENGAKLERLTDDLILKPFAIPDLLSAVRSLLAKR